MNNSRDDNSTADDDNGLTKKIFVLYLYVTCAWYRVIL